MGKYYAAEALFSIIGLYGTACPVSELSSALYSSDVLSDLICSFQSGMPVDIADVIDAARVSELPPLRGLEEMISTFLFIVMLSLLFAFSVP